MPLVKTGILLLLGQVSARIRHSHVSCALFGSNYWEQGRLFLWFEKLQRGWVGCWAEELWYLAILANGLLVLALPLLLYGVSCWLVWILIALEALLVTSFFTPGQI